MRPAYDMESSYASGGSLRRRTASLIVAIAANLLLVLMLLRLAGVSPAPVETARMVVFGVRSERPSEKKAERKATKAERKAATAKTAPAPRVTIPKAAATPAAKPFSWSEFGVIQLERKDYAASDVGRITPHPADRSGSSEVQAADSGAGDSERAGTGPNGEPLYAAEWYREPTDAELSTYVAGRAQPGAWAEVACRTVARFHVDDCVELGDSPPGSRLAGAIRQAAFQFLVRPPRVGGRSQVGTWVRIHISFGRLPR